MGGGDQEVAAAAGGVADLEGENSPLGIGLPGGLVKHRIERRVEQALDQIRRRVVAARSLSLVAARRSQLEGAGVRANLGVQLEERLVHAAQLLGAEVTEIH